MLKSIIMDIKFLLTFVIVEASALCPIGFQYSELQDKCLLTCKDCQSIQIENTRRQLTNVIHPSKADLALISDKFKYAVQSFVDSEGMIDTYICPTAWRYDFDKKSCMPPKPKTRRYFQVQPLDCPYCNLKEDTEKIEPIVSEGVDIFTVPQYMAGVKTKNKQSLAQIIEKVMKLYQSDL